MRRVTGLILAGLGIILLVRGPQRDPKDAQRSSSRAASSR